LTCPWSGPIRRAGTGDLETWLTGPPEPPDVIVIGLQEIVELEIKKNASMADPQLARRGTTHR